jgi:hypothetical protein
MGIEDNLGALEFDDDFLIDESSEEEEILDDDKKDNSEEDDDQEDDQEELIEESQEEENFLSDEKILETYGQEVDPTIVRHYEVIKDYLILDEEFKFNGSNIEDAYALDSKNRTDLIAQNIIDKLPETHKILLQDALKHGQDLKPETLNELLTLNKEQLENTYDENDEKSIKNYIKKVLIQKGEDPDDVDDVIELYEEKGKLKVHAKKLKEEINSVLDEQKESKRIADINEANAIREKNLNRLNSVNEVLESTKFKNSKKQSLKNYIFGKFENTNVSPLVATLKQINENPKALIQLADLISYYDNKSGEWNLKGIEKEVESQISSGAKSKIASKISGNTVFVQKDSKRQLPKTNWDNISF